MPSAVGTSDLELRKRITRYKSKQGRPPKKRPKQKIIGVILSDVIVISRFESRSFFDITVLPYKTMVIRTPKITIRMRRKSPCTGTHVKPLGHFALRGALGEEIIPYKLGELLYSKVDYRRLSLERIID